MLDGEFGDEIDEEADAVLSQVLDDINLDLRTNVSALTNSRLKLTLFLAIFEGTINNTAGDRICKGSRFESITSRVGLMQRFGTPLSS